VLRTLRLGALSAALLSACAASEPPAGGPDATPADAGRLDAAPEDAAAPDAAPEDAGVADAGPTDAEPPPDAAPRDAGEDADAGVVVRTPKSLVLAWDGVRPDALAYARTPRLDALIQGTWSPGYRGAYTGFAQNLTDAATVSGPNHAAIMCGSTGRQHGVTSNADVGSGDFETFVHYLRAIEAAAPERHTAYLFTWGTDALITSGADYIVDGEDESNVGRVAGMLSGTWSDAGWPAGTDPDAIFLFLDDSDAAGHRDGFELGVAEYITALEDLDEQLGRLLDALSARPTFAQEDWQIVLTSDHGGYHLAHGGGSSPERTIPLLVASRHVMQGRLPSGARHLDVVPTVLTHMGVAVPAGLTGRPRGDVVEAPAPAALEQDLVRYHRFEGDLRDEALGQAATVGAESDVPPTVHAAGGKFGGYVQIDDLGGGASQASYLTLAGGPELDFGDQQAFTVTLWFRPHARQSGDPAILGNKDWRSGQNRGWLVLANEGGADSFGTNFAGMGTDRLDLEDLDYTGGGWWFVAAVFSPDGLAITYAGDEAGGLRWMALDATGVGDLTSPLPLNLGQDGLGTYPHNLDGDVDDLALWRRALTHEEVLRLYDGGLGAELAALR
jgi:hypothetical protein